MAADVGAKEDAYAKNLSYRVLNFASARGNVVHEVFLFGAYIVIINVIFLAVCFYHVTYAFQSEYTLYSCLNVKELLA